MLRVSIAIFAVMAGSATAQRGRPKADAAHPDPYTAGEPARMAKAGCVGFGPFAIDERHSTAEVAALLGDSAPLWLETAHFKLGARLPEYRIPPGDRIERDKLRRELSTLHTRLPAVDVATRRLDPWLRMHLCAQRLEEAYASFASLVEPIDVEGGGTHRASDLEGRGRGTGAFLGKDDKFVVLVFATRADLARYTVDHLGRACMAPQREDLGVTAGMLFATALDADTDLATDSGLHCHLVYAVVENMVAAYRGHFFDLPPWIEAGLAQSFVLAIDPRHPNFDRGILGPSDPKPRGDFAARVRSLTDKQLAPPFDTMAESRSTTDFTGNDFAFAWSRVVWLRSLGDDAFAQFMAALKAPLPVDLSRPTRELVLDRQRTALRSAFGITSYDDFDRKWRAWVLATR